MMTFANAQGFDAAAGKLGAQGVAFAFAVNAQNVQIAHFGDFRQHRRIAAANAGNPVRDVHFERGVFGQT